MTEIHVWVDGSCRGNPGPGGWAAIMTYEGSEITLTGNHPNTTNNRMELQALIAVLQRLENWEAQPVVNVYTDSQYVQVGVDNVEKWQASGWRNSARKPVKNDDLWRIALPLIQKYKPNIIWVEGHADNAMNNRVDVLAYGAIK